MHLCILLPVVDNLKANSQDQNVFAKQKKTTKITNKKTSDTTHAFNSCVFRSQMAATLSFCPPTLLKVWRWAAGSKSDRWPSQSGCNIDDRDRMTGHTETHLKWGEKSAHQGGKTRMTSRQSSTRWWNSEETSFTYVTYKSEHIFTYGCKKNKYIR